jgi:hypothetical protein
MLLQFKGVLLKQQNPSFEEGILPCLIWLSTLLQDFIDDKNVMCKPKQLQKSFCSTDFLCAESRVIRRFLNTYGALRVMAIAVHSR